MSREFDEILSLFFDRQQRGFCQSYGAFLQELMEQSEMSFAHILDYGCGTGCLAEALARRGHRVQAIDESETMLSRARQRSADLENVEFICGGLMLFVAPNQYSLIVCNNDTINDVTEVDALENLFRRVKENLQEDGLFVLDFATGRHYERMDNQLDHYEVNGVTFSKKVRYDPVKHLVENVFEYEGKKEIHYQRAYMLKEVQHALAEAGLGVVDVFSDFEGRLISPETTERIFITAAHILDDC